jgi:hypothetical protein
MKTSFKQTLAVIAIVSMPMTASAIVDRVSGKNAVEAARATVESAAYSNQDLYNRCTGSNRASLGNADPSIITNLPAKRVYPQITRLINLFTIASSTNFNTSYKPAIIWELGILIEALQDSSKFPNSAEKTTLISNLQRALSNLR